nr:hypothetical protein [Tanacetum cinerariifolium]
MLLSKALSEQQHQPKAVVSATERNMDNAIKSSACWIWRPKGNLIDHISKDSESYTLKRFDYVDPQGRLKGNAKGGFVGNQTNGNAGTKDPAKEGDKNDQKKDVIDQEEALRKQLKQEFEILFGQGEAANTNSTNRLNIVSSLVNAVSSSFPTVDPGRERAQRNEFESMFGQDKDANGNNTYRMFTLVSAAGSSYVNLGGSIPVNAATLPNPDLPTTPLMPDLEDTADLQDTRIFSGVMMKLRV